MTTQIPPPPPESKNYRHSSPNSPTIDSHLKLLNDKGFVALSHGRDVVFPPRRPSPLLLEDVRSRG